MGKKIARITAISLWSVLLVSLLWMGLYSLFLPETITVVKDEEMPSYPCVSFVSEEDENAESHGLGDKAMAVLMALEAVLKKL